METHWKTTTSSIWRCETTASSMWSRSVRFFCSLSVVRGRGCSAFQEQVLRSQSLP